MTDFKWHVVEALRRDAHVRDVFVDSQGLVIVDFEDGQRVAARIDLTGDEEWTVQIARRVRAPKTAARLILRGGE